MTTLATGSSVSLTLAKNGFLEIATNGGLGSVSITPTGGALVTAAWGPEPVRKRWQGYPEGAAVVLSNLTAPSVDYETDSGGLPDAVQALVSGAGNPAAPVGRPTRLYLGDSLTQYSARLGTSVTASSGTFGGGGWAPLWAEWDCEPGAGTLTYDAAAKTMQWTPLAGAAGPAVDASKTGMLFLPGGVAGHGLWIVWFGASATYTSGTGTATVGAAGLQVWRTQDGGQGGFAPWAQAYSRQAFALAPLPASCPPGMDGYYGLGGANAAHMLAAYPQWSQVSADSAVICLGSNDCQQGVAVADYVRDILIIIDRLFSIGARYVIWMTVPPRDSDTTAQRQWKTDAARRMYVAQTGLRNRLHILDSTARVTDPAAGANQGKWRTNYALDGIHPSTAGAMAMGRALAEVDRQSASQGIYLGTVGDVWDVAANPSGNILNAVAAGTSVMDGTGGSIGTGAVSVGAWAGTTAYVLGQPAIAGGRLYVATTAGTSGSTAPLHTGGQAADGTVVWRYIASGAVAGIATGWTASRSVGAAATVACCKVARTDGVPGDWQMMISYGAAATEGHQIQTAASTTGFVVGAQYVLDTECMHILSQDLNNLGTQIVINGGLSGAKQASWGLSLSSSTTHHADEMADPHESLVLSTAPGWVTVSVSTTFRALLATGIRAGGYAVVAFGRTQLRRIA